MTISVFKWFRSVRGINILTVVCQLLVGATFVFSGLSKAIDPVGTAIKITEYMMHFGLDSLTGLAMGMSWMLSLIEFSLGFFVIIGHHRIMSAFFVSIFMVVMTPLSLYLALYNPVDDCGCFGDVWVLSNWGTFAKNVVLFALVVWLWWHRTSQKVLLSRSYYALYYYVEMSGVLVLLFLGTWQLPYIDFRAYRPGVSLVDEKMSQTNDSDYIIVYEKDGEQREFSLDALPDEDSGWTFVETRQPAEQVHSGSPASELVIFDEGNEEVTRSVLTGSEYVMLLISPDLREAREHDIDRIETLYEYALEHGYAFYCLTQRDPGAIEHWQFRTGSEYPFVYADKQVIETMIRSNPGFMLLHNGTILWKSHLSGIDVPQLTSAKLSEQTLGQIQPINRKMRVFWVIVWLIAPLLLYLPLQIVKHSRKLSK